MEINGKIVLVTGGGSGMGAETAEYLSSKGAKLVILDQNETAANGVAAKVNGFPVTCNVSNREETEFTYKKIVDEWGVPRVCINCAGIAPAKRIVGRDGPMALEEFEKVISVNLIGTFSILRLAASYMSTLEPVGDDHERGVIINTASIAAFEGQIGQSAYSASKGGVCALTLPAARELADFNIRVVAIAPGMIRTPLLEGLHSEIQERLAANIPFPHRFGQPTEFAMLAAHVIENPYINGTILRLDAGLRMQAK